MQFFQTENITIRIGRPPRGSDMKLPLVVIETQSDNEMPENDLLDDFQEVQMRGSMNAVELHGDRVRSTYAIVCCGKDNRMARTLWRVCRALIIHFRQTFEHAGFQNRRLGGGQEGEIDLPPVQAETKVLTLTGEYWFEVGISERLCTIELSVIVTPVLGTSVDE